VTDEWHHLVGTWDGNNIVLYINGELVGTEVFIANSLYDGEADIGIAGNTGVRDYFNGSIDETIIFDYALSADEVLNLFNGNMPGEESGSVIPGDLNGDGVVNLIDLVGVESLFDLLLVGRNVLFD